MSEEVTEEMTTLGERLQQARKEKGYSLDEMAQRLVLPVYILESFENNIFELPNRNVVFLKGYLKRYLKMLSLPENLADEVMRMSEKQPKMIHQKRHTTKSLWLIVIIVLIIGGGISWFFFKGQDTLSNYLSFLSAGNKPRVTDSQTATQSPLMARLENTAPLSSSMENNTTDPTSPAQSLAEHQSNTNQANTDQTDNNQSSQHEQLSHSSNNETLGEDDDTHGLQIQNATFDEGEKHPFPDSLKNLPLAIEFSGTSWVEVWADDKRITSKTFTAEQNYFLEQNANIRLTIGASQHVKVYRFGKIVTLNNSGITRLNFQSDTQ